MNIRFITCTVKETQHCPTGNILRLDSLRSGSRWNLPSYPLRVETL